jgi:acyl-CoA reductase-like NAD-dependent aldehyde dehydrogenase
VQSRPLSGARGLRPGAAARVRAHSAVARFGRALRRVARTPARGRTRPRRLTRAGALNRPRAHAADTAHTAHTAQADQRHTEFRQECSCPSPRCSSSIDPATGEPVGEVARHPRRRPSPASSHVPAPRRRPGPPGASKRVVEVPAPGRARACSPTADALGRLITREMGKPAARGRRRGQGLRRRLVGRTRRDGTCGPGAGGPRGRRDAHDCMCHDPLGVCAAITPWNFPLEMAALDDPARRSSRETRWSSSRARRRRSPAQALCRPAQRGAAPGRAASSSTGTRRRGKALVAADVDLIAFTGSRAAGRQILAAASTRPEARHPRARRQGSHDRARRRERSGLAARFAARNSFRNCGQVCVSTERIYVDRAVAEALSGPLLAGRDRQDDGRQRSLEARTVVGPMVAPVAARPRPRSRSTPPWPPAPGSYSGGAGHHGNFVDADGPDRRDACDMDVVARGDLRPGRRRHPGGRRRRRRAPRQRHAVRPRRRRVRRRTRRARRRVARRLTAGMIGINRGVGGATGTPWVGARHSGYGYHKGVVGPPAVHAGPHSVDPGATPACPLSTRPVSGARDSPNRRPTGGGSPGGRRRWACGRGSDGSVRRRGWRRHWPGAGRAGRARRR